jgi:hypothetical protein
LMNTGISKIVTIVEIRNAENRIMKKSFIYSEVERSEITGSNRGS